MQPYTMVDIDNSRGVRTVFKSCPIRFIPQSAFSFLTCRNYYNEHPSAVFPTLENVSPRYRHAENVYNNALSEAAKV